MWCRSMDWVSVCLSLFLFFFLSLSVCLFSLSLCLSVSRSLCLSFSLSVCQSVCLSVCLSVSIHLHSTVIREPDAVDRCVCDVTSREELEGLGIPAWARCNGAVVGGRRLWLVYAKGGAFHVPGNVSHLRVDRQRYP
jgi:hypothetical protein